MKAKEKLNEIENNSDDIENVDIKYFDKFDFLSPLLCNNNLLKKIINQINEPSIEFYYFQMIETISEYDKAMILILEFISQIISENYLNDIFCQSELLCNQFDISINLLTFLSNDSNFSKKFIDICSNNLIDIILSPNWRNEVNFLSKTAKLFLNLEVDLPIRLTHLISFCFISKDEDAISYAINLCSKFNTQQLANINDIIINYLDNILEDETRSLKKIEAIIQSIPWIIKQRSKSFIQFLDEHVDYYLLNNIYKRSEIDFISKIFNELAPEYGHSMVQSEVDNSGQIPESIRSISPIFWDIFEKYSKKIFELIDDNPLLLDKFNFLLRFPELLSFKLRSLYFRKKMQSKISFHMTDLYIYRSNLLESSFREFQFKSKHAILNKFNIKFVGEKGSDASGLTREWFTLLSKEIFNQNYGLFCSTSKFSYIPNSLSNTNPDHLQYFEFAGKFIARALIQGICIDVHLTLSFLKEILHRKPELNDLQDIDEDLYQSLKYIQENDNVDDLEITFAVDKDEFGVIKTIPLKENGEKILLNNENKNEYVYLRYNYALKGIIEDQLKAFSKGFDLLISHDEIKIFSPSELDLLICGIPEIDINDFKNHVTFIKPYDAQTPVILLFFKVISNWNNEQRAKLLFFMTGSSRVPANGFSEFCQLSHHLLSIGPGGDRTKLPQAHTCFNTLCLPEYQTEKESNDKLLLAIYEADKYELV